jgi:hypothetical protein
MYRGYSVMYAPNLGCGVTLWEYNSTSLSLSFSFKKKNNQTMFFQGEEVKYLRSSWKNKCTGLYNEWTSWEVVIIFSW